MDASEFQQFGSSTPKFSLVGINTFARFIGNYDGDTCTLVIPVHGQHYKFNVRLLGIDTCEIKSKNAKCKELAIQARNRVFQLATSCEFDNKWTRKQLAAAMDATVHMVWIECSDMDKYGRPLVRMFTPTDRTLSFQDTLIGERLACSYDGAAKMTEEQQVNQLTKDE
jgi:endonuclease YncB( thermonuclease family)